MRKTMIWTTLAAPILVLLGSLSVPSAAQAEVWFGAPINTPLSEEPVDLAAGLINDDEYEDVVVLTEEAALLVYLGDGTGHFTLGGSYIAGGSHGWRLDLGDLDGDGTTDVAVIPNPLSGPYKCYVHFNDGFGDFSDPPLVLGTPPRQTALTVGDLDGDQHNEVVVGCDNGGLAVYWGDAGGPQSDPDVFLYLIYCPYIEARAIALADITNDGMNMKDIVGIANEYNYDPESCGPDQRAFFLIRNHGDRSLGPSVEFLLQEPLGSRWWDFDVADLDNDDDLDVAIAQKSGHVLRTFLNNGDGDLLEGARITLTSAQHVALADFNGNDDVDVAFSPRKTWPAKVWAGDGEDDYELVQELGTPLANVLAANITANPGPDLVGLYLPYEGTDYRLVVVPNVTYMDPAGVEDPLSRNDVVLRVAPAVINGSGCTIELQGIDVPSLLGVRLDVLDITGRVRATLEVDGARPYAQWDGTDGDGEELPSGVYWVQARGLPHVSARVTVIR